MEESSMLFMY